MNAADFRALYQRTLRQSARRNQSAKRRDEGDGKLEDLFVSQLRVSDEPSLSNQILETMSLFALYGRGEIQARPWISVTSEGTLMRDLKATGNVIWTSLNGN